MSKHRRRARDRRQLAISGSRQQEVTAVLLEVKTRALQWARIEVATREGQWADLDLDLDQFALMVYAIDPGLHYSSDEPYLIEAVTKGFRQVAPGCTRNQAAEALGRARLDYFVHKLYNLEAEDLASLVAIDYGCQRAEAQAALARAPGARELLDEVEKERLEELKGVCEREGLPPGAALAPELPQEEINRREALNSQAGHPLKHSALKDFDGTTLHRRAGRRPGEYRHGGYIQSVAYLAWHGGGTAGGMAAATRSFWRIRAVVVDPDFQLPTAAAFRENLVSTGMVNDPDMRSHFRDLYGEEL